MVYHGDIYYDAAVNATTTPSPPLVLRRLDPHTAMSEHRRFFLSPIRKDLLRKRSNPSCCEGGFPQLKKTDNTYVCSHGMDGAHCTFPDIMYVCSSYILCTIILGVSFNNSHFNIVCAH